MGCKPPYPNSQLDNHSFGSRDSRSNSQQFYALVLLLVTKTCNAAGSCVSTGSLSSTTGRVHHGWCDKRLSRTDSLCWRLCQQCGSSPHAGHAPLGPHGCSTISAPSSLASHPSSQAVPRALAHKLPPGATPAHALPPSSGSALALNALLLPQSCAAHGAWQRTSMV